MMKTVNQNQTAIKRQEKKGDCRDGLGVTFIIRGGGGHNDTWQPLYE